mgnify:CR=1 FL=1|jgi:hypothetical protein
MDIQELIRRRAVAAGVDPSVALRIATIESSMDPTANMNTSSQYKGLYQLGPEAWSAHGRGNIYDAGNNTDAFLNLYKANSSTLENNLGRAPTPAETYLAHQQGAAGATALLQNPDKNAVDALTPLYGSRNVATSAIKKNGGDPAGTAGDFIKMWSNKFNQTGSQTPAQPQQQSSSDNLPIFARQQTQDQIGGLLANNSADRQKDLLQQNAANSLMTQGLGLMAAGAPQQTWQPTAAASVHRPQDLDKLFYGLLG